MADPFEGIGKIGALTSAPGIGQQLGAPGGQPAQAGQPQQAAINQKDGANISDEAKDDQAKEEQLKEIERKLQEAQLRLQDAQMRGATQEIPAIANEIQGLNKMRDALLGQGGGGGEQNGMPDLNNLLSGGGPQAGAPQGGVPAGGGGGGAQGGGAAQPVGRAADAGADRNQSGAPADQALNAPAGELADGEVAGVAKGTGYYPANNRMEGGFKDMKGNKLNTLQDFLDGKASYVSMAMDKKLYKNGTVKYGDTFRIKEMEQKYGRQIPFKAVDTGGAFTGKGFSRVDICTRNSAASHEKTVNGRLTLSKVGKTKTH